VPDFYTVSYEFQGQLKTKKVYAENAPTAIVKIHDLLRTTEPLFIHTFEVKEVKLTYATQSE
jgi:hypothetical protein